MNPRQAKEYKHSQKVKAEEMRHKREEMEKKGLSEKICDCVEETIEGERAKAEWIYGKDAKGKMSVNIDLKQEGKILIKAVFVPAEGVKPIEGRADFGITRNVKW
jgi:hypothetical protein